MSAVAQMEIDTSEFMDAFRQFQATSKKSVADNIRKEGRLLATAILQLTPPNKEKQNKALAFIPSWNKSGGDKTIANDLAKVFRESKKGITNPAELHQRFRVRRGRIFNKTLKTETTDKRIRVSGLAAYKKMVQKRVGYMAAGWSAAANSLGSKVPDWIARHRAPGRGGVKTFGNKVEVFLTNDAVYPQSRNLLERRVGNALTFRAKTMLKQVNKYVAKNAQSAGFTVGGS
jgi:hypothetical protein